MSEKMLYMLDPVAEVEADDTPPATMGEFEGKVIGFIDNGWWSLGKVFGRFEELCYTEAGVAKVLWRKKADASNSAPKEVIEELVKDSDAVVVGLGN